MKRSTRYRRSTFRSTRLRRVLLALSAGCLLIAAALLIRYAWHAVQTGRALEELRQVYQTETAEASPNVRAAGTPAAAPEAGEEAAAQAAIPQVDFLPMATPAPNAAMMADFVGLYSRNKDLAGWLRSDAVPEIDFPVVLRDNAFYMNHDYYGRENLAGTVFLDQSCAILPRSDNLVLHGHNMKNGSMFGKLHLYLEEDLLRAQPMFTFSTLYETSVYVPYAVSLLSTRAASTRFASYVQSGFAGGEEMLSFSRRLQELSLYEIPVDVRAGDRLLTLATCHGNEDSERLIVALRELRPGEEKEALAASIRNGLTSKKQAGF